MGGERKNKKPRNGSASVRRGSAGRGRGREEVIKMKTNRVPTNTAKSEKGSHDDLNLVVV